MDNLNSFLSAPPTQVIAIILIPVTAVYLLRRWALPKPFPGIPYNHEATKSIWGDGLEIKAYRATHGEVRNWFWKQNLRHNSPIVQIFLAPFSKPILIVSDFRETEDMLTSRSKVFDRSSRFTEAFEGAGTEMLTAIKSTDPRYKPHKELLKDTMSPSFLQQVALPHVYSKACDLVQLWVTKAHAARGRPFEAHEDIYISAFDNILAVAVGEERSLTKMQQQQLESMDLTNDSESIDQEVEFPRLPTTTDLDAFVNLGHRVVGALVTPHVRFYNFITSFYPTIRKSKVELARVDKFYFDQGIQNAENGKSPSCAMDFLIHRELNMAKKDQRPPAIHSTTLYDEINGYIEAGHDTTATTMSWAVKLIAGYPEAQAKLRNTLRQAYKSALDEKRIPTADEITKVPVPYLDAYIQELHRTAGTFVITNRQATEDTIVLGHHVPKGTVVVFTSRGPGYTSPAIPIDEAVRSQTSQSRKGGNVSRSEWSQSDIDHFIPERWMKKGEDGSTDVYDALAGPFMAFGTGPRGCFGRRLAYIQVRLALVLLIWKFEFQEVPPPLNSFAGVEKFTTVPRYCFVRLREI